MASTCNPATGRRDEVDGLRLGQLLESGACRSGVRTRPGIDMDRLEESGRSSLNQLRRDETQPKVPVSDGSRIAPVSAPTSAAQSISVGPSSFCTTDLIQNLNNYYPIIPFPFF